MSKATTLIEDKKYLIEAALPEATSSYTVIPHELVIDTVFKQIEAKGFTVIKEAYKYNAGAQVACGIYYLSHSTDDEMGMVFTWTNSYDKSVRFKCLVGAYIKLNNNIIISDAQDTVFKRKHTGDADNEVEQTIADQLSNAISYYDELVKDKNLMQQYQITDSDFASMIGRLYITEKLLSSEQINIIKREFLKPSYEYECGKNCVWTLYNYILTAIIKCHPSKWVEQQRTMHLWIKTDLKLFGTEVETNESTEITAPLEAPVNQVPEVEETVTEELVEETEEAEVIEEVVETPVVEETVITEKPINPNAVACNKQAILSLYPNAGVDSIITLDGIDFIIEDEDDRNFIIVKEDSVDTEDAEEEIAEVAEPVVMEEPVKQFVLPKAPNKITATMPDIKPKDIAIIPPADQNPASIKETDEVRSKISHQILELYGSIREFDYSLVNGQYNVVLESGESCCLTKI